MKQDNPSLVIIDTSAFIEANRIPTSPIGIRVREFIHTGLAALTPLIRWELGRGNMSQQARNELFSYLDGLELLEWEMNWYEFEKFDSQLRNQGYHIPFTDLWIAITAIAHHCCLIHKDKHFSIISKYTALKALYGS